MVPPPPAPKAQPTPQPQPVITPPPTPVVKKEVKPEPVVKEVKQTLLDESKKTFATKSTEETNLTKVPPKPAKKLVKKEKIKPKKKLVKEKVIKKTKITKKKTHKKKSRSKRKQRRSNDPLANFLSGTGTSMYPSLPQKSQKSTSRNYNKKTIKNLYGAEFNTYSRAQKDFIRHNLGRIAIITQETANRNGYPDVALRTKQEGTNVVSFYLHPNGDISGLRLKRRLGYAALDQNTIKVIRIAYKDYPLPNKKTKIVFYVQYSLY